MADVTAHQFDLTPPSDEERRLAGIARRVLPTAWDTHSPAERAELTA